MRSSCRAIAAWRVSLPEFSLAAYDALLERLGEAGYAFAPIAELPELQAGQRTVLLRHDVDLDPPSTVAMAQCEAARGIVATYYVPLTVHFNALDRVNGAAIRELRALGHDVGLHYDVRTYPQEPDARRAHLDWEIGVLEGLTGAPVRTISMHQPTIGPPDPFLSGTGFVHPRDPALQENLLYVSDSARAWRDESLLRCFGADAPERLLLLVHPESWLDPSVADPIEYVERVLLPLSLQRARAAYEDEVRAWREHPTARARA